MTLSPESFAFVADLVRRRSAIQLAEGKEYLVESRLLPLAREASLDVDAYVDGLRRRADPGEATRVVEAMTTNETSWFRDGLPYVALRESELPRLVEARRSSGRLSVWSAACSTGQEPYSLAMTMADVLPAGMTGRILATDLSEQVLARARAGRYSQLEVNRGMPAGMLVSHMRRVGTEWEVDDTVRGMVEFRAHNLLDPAPAGPFDVVLLRNVLIYFDLPTKAAILERVRRVLRPDGVLVLGAAETTLGIHEGFERLSVRRTSVYRPLAVDASGAPAPAVVGPPPTTAATGIPLPRRTATPAAATLPAVTATPGRVTSALPRGATR